MNRIIRELFVGIYICHEVPSLSMDPQPDKSVYVSLPAPYHGTLVGDVLKEVDALGKGVIQELVFPEYARREFMETWEKELAPDEHWQSLSYEDILRKYREHGAHLLHDNPAFSAKLKESSKDLHALAAQVGCKNMNYTFVPRQKSIKQAGDVVLLDSDLVVRGGYQIQDVDDATRARFQVAFEKSADGIGEVLAALPEAERPLRLLKIIGFMTQLLVTLQNDGFMPDLNAMPCAPIGYEPEDTMPPFLKPRTAQDSTWYLHGGTQIDFRTVPKSEVSTEGQAIMVGSKAGDKVTFGETSAAREYLTVQMPIVEFDLAGREPKWFVDKLSSFSAHTTPEESEWLQEEERLGRGPIDLLRVAAISDLPGQLQKIRASVERSSPIATHFEWHKKILEDAKKYATNVGNLAASNVLHAWASDIEAARKVARALTEKVVDLITRADNTGLRELLDEDGSRLESHDYDLRKALCAHYEHIDDTVLGLLALRLDKFTGGCLLNQVIMDNKPCALAKAEALLRGRVSIEDQGGEARPFEKALGLAVRHHESTLAMGMLQLLLRYQKPKFYADSEGLRQVMAHGGNDLLTLLLRHGLKVQGFGRNGKNPHLLRAEEAGNTEMVQALQAAGAKHQSWVEWLFQ